jgi:hypothetical protein
METYTFDALLQRTRLFGRVQLKLVKNTESILINKFRGITEKEMVKVLSTQGVPFTEENLFKLYRALALPE